ncbi:MAG: hypothetical protein WBI29_03150 [Candidatus Saccharimonadales bacterium]
MKKTVKESLKLLINNRLLFVSVIFVNLVAVIFAIILVFLIKPSELQLVNHYSAFGITHLYRSQWYYLYVFVAFQLMVSILHSIISVKMLIVKGHSIAMLTIWSGLFVLALGFSTALSVINVWNPLQ